MKQFQFLLVFYLLYLMHMYFHYFKLISFFTLYTSQYLILNLIFRLPTSYRSDFAIRHFFSLSFLSPCIPLFFLIFAFSRVVQYMEVVDYTSYYLLSTTYYSRTLGSQSFCVFFSYSLEDSRCPVCALSLNATSFIW